MGKGKGVRVGVKLQKKQASIGDAVVM